MAVALTIILLVACDQLIKWWAVAVLKPIGTIPIIQDMLHLTYAENTGAAFSIFKGQQWLLIGVTSLGILAILYLLLSKKVERRDYRICLTVIVGGGIGNLIDRIAQGFVVDYVDFRIINYAIFNFADSCVVLGAVAFCILILLEIIREEKARKKGLQTPKEGEDA